MSRKVRRSRKSIADLPELLTLEEWRKYARVGRTLAYSMVRSGQLAHVRFGAAIRIPRSTLDTAAK
jgi:excisionase family DNA binding protein